MLIKTSGRKSSAERWALGTWNANQIRPDLARLVARPYLVVPFTEFGKAPRDAAKRQTAIEVGTVLWKQTPFGPGAHFTNSTLASPTDYLRFRGTYPNNNATAVPHSLAVLWQPRGLSFAAIPFTLGSDAIGSRSVGLSGEASTPGFKVTHFGVVGFTGIGPSAVANRYYLQMYSYDQVTVNHMVVDLTTGAVSSQAIAETRAINAFSPGPLVGFLGPNEALQGVVAGAAWVRGAWTLDEMELIAGDPVGLWTPYRRKHRVAYAPTSAFTTYSHTMAGGVSTSGAGVVSLAKSIVFVGGVQSGGAAAARVSYVPAAPSGGVTTSGTASTQSTRAHTMAGGVQTGGASASKNTRAIVMSGGAQTAGVAAARVTKTVAMSGGVQTGGSATGIFARGYKMTGGVSTGGAATLSRRYGWSSSGGVQTGGQAGIVFQGVFNVTMSGGVQSGGSAIVSRFMRPPAPTGGVSTGGSAIAWRVYGVRGVGGVTTAGAAVLSSVRRWGMLGGTQTGGQAFAQYVFGGTILAAWSATFRARPVFGVRLEARPMLEATLRLSLIHI